MMLSLGQMRFAVVMTRKIRIALHQVDSSFLHLLFERPDNSKVLTAPF
jgi:hypothetical protein